MRSLVPIAILFFTTFLTAAAGDTITVGPKGRFPAPCDGIRAARPGDVIEIDATGVYRGDVCAWATPNLTLRGVNGRAKLDANGKSAQGKAIWVINGDNNVVENIEFTGARVPDLNGAGIRLGGRGLTVRNCYFHHNQEGILGGDGGTVLIEHSEFGVNGHSNGRSHNLYILHAEKLIFRFNYSYSSIGGHLLKSRAAENHILYNRLSSEGGAGSLEVDIPNGGRTFIVGNVIQQGPSAAASVNGNMVGYQMEGPHERNPLSELWVVNNTLVNEKPGYAQFFLLPQGFSGKATFRNNLIVGGGTLGIPVSATAEANLLPAEPAFFDQAALDLRIRPASPAADAGVDPGFAGEFSLAPELAYVHPACGGMRQTEGIVDIGAYETTDLAEMSGQPERCKLPVESELAAVNAAAFIPGPLTAGAIVSVFGENLAGFTYHADEVPLPTAVGTIAVELDGKPLPIYSIDPNQINVQLPEWLEAGPHTLAVVVGGRDGLSTTVDIQETAPQIFVFSNSDRAIAQNQDWSLNGPDQPAKPGEYVIFYLNGIGAVQYLVPSGSPAFDAPLNRSALSNSATVGGAAAELPFLGLTPGLVGVAQANIKMPDLPDGEHPAVITIGEVLSNAAMVSIAN